MVFPSFGFPRTRRKHIMNDCLDLSSGDASNSKTILTEENNNEVNNLTRDLAKMDCVVNSKLNNPETGDDGESLCVNDKEKLAQNGINGEYDKGEDSYASETFEEDDEDATAHTSKDNKMIKVFTQKRIVSEKSTKDSLSSNSVHTVQQESPSSEGSHSKHMAASVVSNGGCAKNQRRQSQRLNMSFSNNQFREIERQNHILLTKILNARKTKSSLMPTQKNTINKPPPGSHVKKQKQMKIERENLILLRKIQTAKSSTCTFRR